MGRRRIKITVCNVPIALNEEVLAAYLIKYGNIENIEKAKSTNGTAHGDYVCTMCLDRGGFTAIPHVIEYEDRAMTVVVEGRKPQCWNCKQLGHFSKSCPQKTTTKTTTTNTTTTAATAAAATVAEPNETSKAKTVDSPDKEEGWTQVQRGGKKRALLKQRRIKTQWPLLFLLTLQLLLLQQPKQHHHHHHQVQLRKQTKKLKKKLKKIEEKMKIWIIPRI